MFSHCISMHFTCMHTHKLSGGVESLRGSHAQLPHVSSVYLFVAFLVAASSN